MNGILKALSSLTSSGAGLLVVCLFAGALAAACASSFVYAAVGSAVRAMISHGANAEEKALGLDELGVGKNIFVRAALKRRRGLLSRLVGRVERDGSAAYWLPESSREKAEAIYGGKKQNPLLLPLSVILLAVAAIALVRLLPKLIEMLAALLPSK